VQDPVTSSTKTPKPCLKVGKGTDMVDDDEDESAIDGGRQGKKGRAKQK
jgi:hypothetical protein